MMASNELARIEKLTEELKIVTTDARERETRTRRTVAENGESEGFKLTRILPGSHSRYTHSVEYFLRDAVMHGLPRIVHSEWLHSIDRATYFSPCHILSTIAKHLNYNFMLKMGTKLRTSVS